ncbi:DUF982 domain-containing protein [Phyllobacterium endophyticum]|jgi:hypothetical protein|uniref:DUF982 domain-containing protein n=1 Tax=Phyllobacterium endophyticum TaxID=1149773 RepID=A0A2P7AWU7_9HYPH|nr:DUF982 domain-containing protein [Phyllobacterium endophyticum]MBB3238197.1 hypothetical protein [Phyllobacterium endophyticum]PSH58690.1 DUF982 domain-containing protein [Phyllobacterium endophyticum]TXR47505.1 DUF982 domain-containing protein [Phyllobacterium endophyticum]TYR39382.1 DUF982 domain-containing protein [Phyllobacterium endophyticum]
MITMDFIAVTIEIDETGELCNVSSVAEASEILLRNWPVQRGKELSRARRACLDAIEGKGSVEEARTAFVAAAKEAGILVWNSAWQF